MTNNKKDYRYPPCPDGGWGWMVVFGSFMIHVIADGVTYSIGQFYYELVKHFGESKTITSMIVSIMNGTTYCIGPIASALTIRYGCRAVTIAGSIFASLGFFLSAFTSQIFMLYGTIGICAGIGFGLMYLPAIVIVTSYFEKKRSFATGIAVCGSGIGTAIMSPLIEYIISLYGWKGAMLIISIILINCSIFGAMFKPLPTIPIPEINENESNDQQQEESALKSLLIQMNDAKNLSVQSSVEINVMKSEPEAKSNINGDNYDDDNNIVKKRSHSFTPGFLIRDDSFYSGSLMNINNSSSTSSKSNHYNNQQFLKFQQNYKNRIDNNGGGGGNHSKNECCLFRRFNLPDEIKENLSEMIDLSLLKNCTFLIFSVSTFLTSVGFHVPFIFLKDWIVTNQIGSTNETGFFTSIIGLSSTISRLVFGYISDRSFINRFWLYIISITFCGIIIVANIFATTYELLVTFCSFFGLTCGTYVSLTSVVLVDLLGLEKLTNAFGLILLFQGIASILGPLFIGFIYDLSGAYDTGFLVIGILVTFSGLMLILIPICKNFKSIKKLFLY